MTSLGTILLSTDFSECSELALQLASSLARDHGARLLLLHVEQPPQVCCGDAGPLVPEPEDYEDALFKKLCSLGVSGANLRLEHYLKEGRPATEILRMAQETPCDLVVMGSHGRKGWERFFMGSVAEEVLRKATCPVLIVRAKSDKESCSK